MPVPHYQPEMLVLSFHNVTFIYNLNSWHVYIIELLASLDDKHKYYYFYTIKL